MYKIHKIHIMFYTILADVISNSKSSNELLFVTNFSM